MSIKGSAVSQTVSARFARVGSFTCLAMVLALSACKSSKGGSDEPESKGPSGGPSTPGGGSPTAPSGGSSSASLTGEWRLVGQYQGGKPTRGTLLLSATEFSLTITQAGSTLVDISATVDDGTVASIDVTDRNGDTTEIFGKRDGGQAMNLGAMPLPLGGDWVFVTADGDPDDPRGCVSTLSTDDPSFLCLQTRGMLDWARSPGPVIEHRETSPSMFGELGGTWVVSDLGSGASQCEIRFERNEVSVECENLTELEGGLRITFDGDVASGTSRNGLELSATRE